MRGKWKLNTERADREFWIWLAGFFDGEGSILLGRYTRKRDGFQRIKTEVLVANTSKIVMQEIAEILDMPLYEEKRHDRKYLYTVRICKHENVSLLLEKLIPHLKVKRVQAELLYAYCMSRVNKPHRSDYTPEELQIFRKIRELNKIHGRSTYTELTTES
jgi:hypothetical protein